MKSKKYLYNLLFARTPPELFVNGIKISFCYDEMTMAPVIAVEYNNERYCYKLTYEQMNNINGFDIDSVVDYHTKKLRKIKLQQLNENRG